MNTPVNRFAWRPRDIVLASVVGVVSGGIFALWNIANAPILEPLGALLPGFQALGHGVWLLGGLLTALIVRRPGAALYGEVLAATVSALMQPRVQRQLDKITDLLERLENHIRLRLMAVIDVENTEAISDLLGHKHD